MLEGGREKFLVFAHHKSVLDHITAELEKKVGKTHRCSAPHRPNVMTNTSEAVLLSGVSILFPLITLMQHNDFLSVAKDA